MRDFAPISAFARVQQALVINPAVLDVATLQQFIDVARRKPASIDVGSPGIGTVNHLAISLFEDRADITLTHMPYRGSGPAIQDLLGGHIAAIFNPVANLIDHVRSGKLRVLGIAGRRREAMLPDVPTLHEAGLADFCAVAWMGLFAGQRTGGDPRPHACGGAGGAGERRGQAGAGRPGRQGGGREARRFRPLRRPSRRLSWRPPAMQDLLGGQVAAMFHSVGAVASYVNTGKLRALAVAGRRREAWRPNVPTMEEAGVKDFRAAARFGMFAPSRTPAVILDRTHAAVQAVLDTDR